MRNLHLLDHYRIIDPKMLQWTKGWAGDETVGAFLVKSRVDGKPLRVIASNGEGWDHVSVSRAKRCPNWDEMEHVAMMFFEETEIAMQLHVPASEHVNNHPYCLHWWRPHNLAIPQPPAIMVGVKSAGLLVDADHARRVQEEALSAF